MNILSKIFGKTASPSQKKYLLQADEIKPLATGRGGCLATDRIVVDGRAVGYMYREAASNPQDSGWRFFAGDEDSAYMANKNNHAVYDVDTIVNYCPAILPFLDAAVGCAFERIDGGSYIAVES
jgi:hypothetical protein